MQSLVEIGPVVLGRRFLNFVDVFSLFRNHLVIRWELNGEGRVSNTAGKRCYVTFNMEKLCFGVWKGMGPVASDVTL